jgi:hypothetical protein
MSIMAFRGSPVADSTVPLTTCLIQPMVKFCDLFLFRGGAAVSSTIILEVMSFKVSKLAKFGQLNVLNFADIPTDGFVKGNDLEMGIWKGSEKLKHVFGILL